MRFIAGFIAVAALLAAGPGRPIQDPAPQDDEGDDWPRELIVNEGKVVLYQPQLESLEGDTMVGRCASSVLRTGQKEPIFGTVWIKARMVTDRGTREVTFTDIDVTNVKFPKASEEGAGKLEKLLEEEIPRWGLKTSMERIAAAQELLEKEQVAADKFKVDPPKILRRTKPCLLLVFDGEPILAEIRGTTQKRVVNTALYCVEDAESKKCYLYLGDRWGEAPNPKGPWTHSPDPPAPVRATAQLDKIVQEQHKAGKDAKKPREFPEIVVVTEPTELVVFEGEEKWAAIADADLHYATNTDAEIFRAPSSGKLYLLASGRWYGADKFDGPWAFVSADKLPEDFKKIPPGHEVADVRASVAGTDEAKEAVLDAKVPQTAAVKRAEGKVEVTYDGEPKWEKVEGLDIQYAVNTSFAVFLVKGKYYCCNTATWYESPTPKGPWVLCTKVPEEIYSLPPSCPHYNVKYVYVYDATPEYVYVGYTPGYCGTYIYGGTVIYGTGWYYRGWWGAWYYPRPVTWGVAVHYNSVTGGYGYTYYAGNPWYGCSFGWTCYWGGWVAVGIGGCVGWYGWHGGDIDIDININSDRINHHRDNVYNRRNDAKNRLEGRPRAGQQPANRPSGQPKISDRKAAGQRNDVHADKDGNVFRNSKDGWQQRDAASREWKKSEAQRAQQRQLDRSAQSRQRSVQRQQAQRSYNSGGGSARRGGGGGRGGGGRR